MQRLRALTDRILEAASVAILLALAGTVLVQTFGRYVLPVQPMWTEEVPGYLLIWLTSIGAALVTRDNGHIGLTLVTHRLPERVRRALQVTVYLVCLAISGVLVYYGSLSAYAARLATSVTLGIPMAWIHAALPVTMGLSFVYLLGGLLGTLRRPGGTRQSQAGDWTGVRTASQAVAGKVEVV